MKLEQRRWQPDGTWVEESSAGPGFAPQLVLVFGDREALESDRPLADLRARYPEAQIVGCSSAGEICDARVCDGSVVASAIAFDRVTVRVQLEIPASRADLRGATARLAESLAAPDLRHVIVFSEGMIINGSELVQGLAAAMPHGVSVTGGLSADGSDFKRTILVSDGRVHDSGFVGIGLYGEALRVGYGSRGGWEPFGPNRTVTRSESNLLLELDGESALEIYRRYLGPHAAGLPATGLLFPLSIELPGEDRPIVRTFKAIDEARGGLIFSADIPMGVQACLMRARLDGLVDGAVEAATTSRLRSGEEPEFALLVSCVGRRLIMHQRTEEELEGVRDTLGQRPCLAGFYSYGEISPFDADEDCKLHNQTMTITTLAEAA